ncbi:MAG: hypothetical protein ABFD57_11110 [Smithella sp.]
MLRQGGDSPVCAGQAAAGKVRHRMQRGLNGVMRFFAVKVTCSEEIVVFLPQKLSVLGWKVDVVI